MVDENETPQEPEKETAAGEEEVTPDDWEAAMQEQAAQEAVSEGETAKAASMRRRLPTNGLPRLPNRKAVRLPKKALMPRNPQKSSSPISAARTRKSKTFPIFR